tara:strand:- start:63 stop:449 length:387 start_codon:yes stop_codon:yes gene_type:complete
VITAKIFKDFELIQKQYEPRMVHTTDIFCPVSHRKEQDGYAELRQDVLQNGMKHPVILIPNTEENYQLAIRQVKTEYIVKRENSKYLCMYGNQRLDIYKDASFSYIWSVLTENVEWSHAVYLELKNSS